MPGRPAWPRLSGGARCPAEGVGEEREQRCEKEAEEEEERTFLGLR